MAELIYGRLNVTLDFSNDKNLRGFNPYLNPTSYGPYDLFCEMIGSHGSPSPFTVEPGIVTGQRITFFTNSVTNSYVILQNNFIATSIFITSGKLVSYVWSATQWTPEVVSSASDGSSIPVNAYNEDWQVFANVSPINGGEFALLTGGAQSNKANNTSPIGYFPPYLRGQFLVPSSYTKAIDSSNNPCIIAASLVPPPVNTFGVSDLALANGDFVFLNIYYQTYAS